MSYKHVIDSSAWVELIRGTEKGGRIKQVIENSQIATSIISIAELSDKFERDEQKFEQAFKSIRNSAAILPLTIEIATHSGKLKKMIRTENNKFSLADAIHLATALSQNAKLITTDSDFAGIKEAIVL